MTKKDGPVTLRVGEPETRSHYDRARDEFKAAKAEGGDVRTVERLDEDPGCPTCHQPMLLRKTFVPPQNYKFEGICVTGAEDHHMLRYGFYATDENAPTTIHLDED